MPSDERFWMSFVLGAWQANCYVLGDRTSGTAVVFDPGQGAADVLVDALAAEGVRCEAILLTHGHLDHLWAAPELAARLDVPVLLHPEDRWLWDDPAAAFGDLPLETFEAQFGLRWDASDEHLSDLREGMALSFAGTAMTVRHTPGHTPGSCVFLIDLPAQREAGVAATAEGLLVVGDLIFAGSVGRTDFPRGSSQELASSISRVVLTLPDGTEIHPGHGPATTVGAERAGNPFLRRIV